MSRRCVLLCVLLAGAAGGCGISPTLEDDSLYVNPQRMSKGLVVILPGIEGPSDYNRGIRQGLFNAGVEYALMIRPWGVPVPGAGMIVNQTNFLGNRLAGASVAQTIADYQLSHPDRPVYIVGHSGGGGVAVFAAESLAQAHGKKVDGLVLIATSISKGYDLTKAMAMTNRGVLNFYNPMDTAMLQDGCIAVGCVDGPHEEGAGLNGFTRSFRQMYEIRVPSADDEHGSGTRPGYVSMNVAPWIVARQWPMAAGQHEKSKAVALTPTRS